MQSHAGSMLQTIMILKTSNSMRFSFHLFRMNRWMHCCMFGTDLLTLWLQFYAVMATHESRAFIHVFEGSSEWEKEKVLLIYYCHLFNQMKYLSTYMYQTVLDRSLLSLSAIIWYVCALLWLLINNICIFAVPSLEPSNGSLQCIWFLWDGIYLWGVYYHSGGPRWCCVNSS